MKTRGRRAVAFAGTLLGLGIAFDCATGGGGSSTYDACKKAGGDTESGMCVLPGRRCDGYEGAYGGYHNVDYICKGDPPVWVKKGK